MLNFGASDSALYTTPMAYRFYLLDQAVQAYALTLFIDRVLKMYRSNIKFTSPWY